MELWRVDSRLPALTFTLALVGLIPSILTEVNPGFGLLGVLLIPLALFQVGFYGTQRLWYLRLLRGGRLELSEVWHMSWRYLGRFFVLGLVAFLIALPFGIVWWVLAFAGAMSAYQPGQSSADLARHISYWPAGLFLLIPSLLLDFAFTFVTPALAFTTRSIGRARRIGFDMIRATWPAGAPYVIFPPLALQLFGSIPMSMSPTSRWVLSLTSIAAVMLNLLAKGATVAFYQRRAEIPDRGALDHDNPDPRVVAGITDGGAPAV